MAEPLGTPSSFWHAKAAIAKTFASRRPPVNVDTRDNICQITRNLYLSSCHLEAQKSALQQHGITHVLQVGRELTPSHPSVFTYKNVSVYDLEEEDLVKHFPECFAFIDAGRNAGGVLVHCAAGISRSATVVIAYLMAHGGLSLEDARAAVKAARPAINPNQGFLLQLKLFQEAGCSAEGWQPWDLERFLQVRSAAYTSGDAIASSSLVRGACEVAPPELSREDSLLSPTASPSKSRGRSIAAAPFAKEPYGVGGSAVQTGLELGAAASGGCGSASSQSSTGAPELPRLPGLGAGMQGRDAAPETLFPLPSPQQLQTQDHAPQSEGRAFLRQKSADDAAQRAGALAAWAAVHTLVQPPPPFWLPPGSVAPAPSGPPAGVLASGLAAVPAAMAPSRALPAWGGVGGALHDTRIAAMAGGGSGGAGRGLDSDRPSWPNGRMSSPALYLCGEAGGARAWASTDGMAGSRTAGAGLAGLSTGGSGEVAGTGGSGSSHTSLGVYRHSEGSRGVQSLSEHAISFGVAGVGTPGSGTVAGPAGVFAWAPPPLPQLGPVQYPSMHDVQLPQPPASLPSAHDGIRHGTGQPGVSVAVDGGRKAATLAATAVDTPFSGSGAGGDSDVPPLLPWGGAIAAEEQHANTVLPRRRHSRLRRSRSDQLPGILARELSAAAAAAATVTANGGSVTDAGGWMGRHLMEDEGLSGRDAVATGIAQDAEGTAAVAAGWAPLGGPPVAYSPRISTDSGASGGGAPPAASGTDAGCDRHSHMPSDTCTASSAGTASAPGGDGACVSPAKSGAPVVPGAQPAGSTPSPPVKPRPGLPWSLQPVLTPAGLERTPSKVPPTPAAGEGAECDVSSPPDGGAAAAGDTARTLWPASPLGPAAAAAAAGKAMGASPGPQSHVIAALALSAASMATAGADSASAVPPNVRADADLTCSRANSLGGGLVGAASGPAPVGAEQQPGEAPQPSQQLQGRAQARHALLAGGAGGGSTSGGAWSVGRIAGMRASRLATATFASRASSNGSAAGGADPDDGTTAATGDASAVIAGRLSGNGGRYGAGGNGARESNDGRGRGSSSGTSTDALLVERSSAPSEMYTPAAASTAAAATAAGVAATLSPSPASAPQQFPNVRLRLSVRSRDTVVDSGGGSGVAATDRGGSGTPIHKRVLRSITSLLGKSPESPTSTAADATSSISAAAAEAPEPPDENPVETVIVTEAAGSSGVVPTPDLSDSASGWMRPSRRRLWGGAEPRGGKSVVAGIVGGNPISAAKHSSAAGPGAAPHAVPGGMVTAAADVAAALAVSGMCGHRGSGSGSAVRSAVSLPPAASALPCDTVANQSIAAAGMPREGGMARSGRGQSSRPSFDTGITARAPPPPAMHISFDGHGSGSTASATSASGAGSAAGARLLSRSRSSSPTCAAPGAAGRLPRVQQPCPSGSASGGYVVPWATPPNPGDSTAEAGPQQAAVRFAPTEGLQGEGDCVRATVGEEEEEDSIAVQLVLRPSAAKAAVASGSQGGPAGLRRDAQELRRWGSGPWSGPASRAASATGVGAGITDAEQQLGRVASRHGEGEVGPALGAMQPQPGLVDVSLGLGIGVDLLPAEPFRWHGGQSVERQHSGGAGEASRTGEGDGTGPAAPAGRISASGGERNLAAAMTAPQPPQPRGPRRAGSRHFSLDGTAADFLPPPPPLPPPSGPGRAQLVPPPGTGVPGGGAAGASAAYIASLAAVASAALLPEPSMTPDLDGPAAATTPSGGALGAVRAAGAPGPAPASAGDWANTTGGGNWPTLLAPTASGLLRAASASDTGLVRHTQHGPSGAVPSEPVGAAEAAVAQHQSAAVAASRRPRSSYSGGGLSMLPPPPLPLFHRGSITTLSHVGSGSNADNSSSSNYLAVAFGAGPSGAGPAGLGLSPGQGQVLGSGPGSSLSADVVRQGGGPGASPLASPLLHGGAAAATAAPSPPLASAQHRHQIGAMSAPSQQATFLAHSPLPPLQLSSPLPQVPLAPALSSPHVTSPAGGGVGRANSPRTPPGAAPVTGDDGGGAGPHAAARPPMPPWGGSRSSAALITMPSETEQEPTAPAAAHAVAAPTGAGGQQQALAPQGKLHASTVDSSGAGPGASGRATVRSSSTGSSAAALPAAAAATGGLPAPDAALRPATGGHAPEQQSRPMRPMGQQASPISALLGLHGALTHAVRDSRVASAPPTAATISPVTLTGWRGAVGGSSSSPTAASAAGGSGGGGSGGGTGSGTQSPRTPPAVTSALFEVDPLPPPTVPHTLHPHHQPASRYAEPSEGNAATAPALSSRPSYAMATAAAGRTSAADATARNRPDPSLLRPVIGRRLLPMPSPSLIMGSPAGTPRNGVAPLAQQQSASSGAPRTEVVAPGTGGGDTGDGGSDLWPAGALQERSSARADLRVLLPHELLPGPAAAAAAAALNAATAAASASATGGTPAQTAAAATAASVAAPSARTGLGTGTGPDAHWTGGRVAQSAGDTATPSPVASAASTPSAAASGGGVLPSPPSMMTTGVAAGTGAGTATAVDAACEGTEGGAQQSGNAAIVGMKPPLPPGGGDAGGESRSGLVVQVAGSSGSLGWQGQKVRSPCGMCGSEDGSGL